VKSIENLRINYGSAIEEMLNKQVSIAQLGERQTEEHSVQLPRYLEVLCSSHSRDILFFGFCSAFWLFLSSSFSHHLLSIAVEQTVFHCVPRQGRSDMVTRYDHVLFLLLLTFVRRSCSVFENMSMQDNKIRQLV
jgi:hypothetical protein